MNQRCLSFIGALHPKEIKYTGTKNWKSICRSKLDGGLGFRSFEDFNQALLAKQAWRIMDNPQSLLTKIFKSRYFPYTNLKSASIGHHPSIVWRGIMWGNELLQKGLRWKIGNGMRINIATDPWIPTSPIFRPISCIPEGSNLCVSHLRLDNKDWNTPMLHHLFSELDVQRIQAIPLSLRDNSDQLIWHYTVDGNYQVKSGYKLASLPPQEASTSDPSSTHLWWRTLWHTQGTSILNIQ